MKKTYMYKQGRGYIVCTWDDKVQCYRTSHEMPYFQARAAVGTDNCPSPQNCRKNTHNH